MPVSHSISSRGLCQTISLTAPALTAHIFSEEFLCLVMFYLMFKDMMQLGQQKTLTLIIVIMILVAQS